MLSPDRLPSQPKLFLFFSIFHYFFFSLKINMFGLKRFKIVNPNGQTDTQNEQKIKNKKMGPAPGLSKVLFSFSLAQLGHHITHKEYWKSKANSKMFKKCLAELNTAHIPTHTINIHSTFYHTLCEHLSPLNEWHCTERLFWSNGMCHLAILWYQLLLQLLLFLKAAEFKMSHVCQLSTSLQRAALKWFC